MQRTPRHVQRVYLTLALFNTMAASLIWGINTLFLLDAGLSSTEAFAANAFFTAGQVLFEVPTGVVADTLGRRTSYLTGAITLSIATALYLLAWQLSAPFWAWAVTSILLGLGFTFFTAGQVLFEVPTGVVADTLGRRTSYLTGAITLSIATALYLLAWQLSAPFWAWAVTSVLLGLGFTFFSGATDAWLVDALADTGYDGKIESVLAKGEIVEGIAMLTGSVAGGLIAQVSNLGVPYLLRAGFLLVTFVVAYKFMRDWGFTPVKSAHPVREVKHVLKMSIDHGFRNRPVRWVMLAAPFTMGVGIYGFYAMQPYLLELYGNPEAYLVAGLSAALVAGSQIVGGLLVPLAGRLFERRTTIMLISVLVSVAVLALIGFIQSFWLAVAALAIWALVWSAATPVRSAYLNKLIPSAQRATVLSFDNLMASSGGVALQPALGRVADTSGYAASYVVCSALQLLALPFTWLSRREQQPADQIERDDAAK